MQVIACKYMCKYLLAQVFWVDNVLIGSLELFGRSFFHYRVSICSW